MTRLIRPSPMTPSTPPRRNGFASQPHIVWEVMKWWGWGEEDVTFTHADKPALRPFIQEHLGVDIAREAAGPIPFEDLRVPDSAVGAALRAALVAALGAEHVSDDAHDRVV